MAAATVANATEGYRMRARPLTLIVLLVCLSATGCTGAPVAVETPSEATIPSVSSQTPTPTPDPDIRVSAEAIQSALIPAGTCGDGETFGWDQRYPIQLDDGSGEEFDASGVGAGIMDSRLVGAEDMNGDGLRDAVLVVDCTGSPKDLCCSGRTSTANFVVVLDMGGATPTRVGDPIAATYVEIPDGDGSREIDGDTVTLEGDEILAHVRLVYPEGLDPADVEANEGWYRFALTSQWSSTPE